MQACTEKPTSPVWSEVKWPFLLDQWGAGRHFDARPSNAAGKFMYISEPRLDFADAQRAFLMTTKSIASATSSSLAVTINRLRRADPLRLAYWWVARGLPGRAAISIARIGLGGGAGK